MNHALLLHLLKPPGISLGLAGLGVGWGCAVEQGDGTRPDMGSSLRDVCWGNREVSRESEGGSPRWGN